MTSIEDNDTTAQVKWIKGHRTEEQRKMTKQQKYIATANETDEYSNLGAEEVGAEMTELEAAKVKESKQRMHAANRYVAS